jgi:hypothetical protein
MYVGWQIGRSRFGDAGEPVNFWEVCGLGVPMPQSISFLFPSDVELG